MKLITLIFLFLLFFSCKQKSETVVDQSVKKKPPVVSISNHRKVNQQQQITPPTSSNFTYATSYVDSIGWGYDIFEGKTLRIHQPHIPAVQGNNGFKSEADAIKVAEKVIEKLHMGIMPPTVSIDEMRDLGVL